MGILDSGQEGRYDAVTKLICHVFNAPISLVSLVDEDKLIFSVFAPININFLLTGPLLLLVHSVNGLSLFKALMTAFRLEEMNLSARGL
jgi:hypothetical protein